MSVVGLLFLDIHTNHYLAMFISAILLGVALKSCLLCVCHVPPFVHCITVRFAVVFPSALFDKANELRGFAVVREPTELVD